MHYCKEPQDGERHVWLGSLDSCALEAEGSPVQETTCGHPPAGCLEGDYLRSLLVQLQVAKQFVQQDRIDYIQDLIDSLVL